MKEMPLEEHLQELRKTLIRILIILSLSFIVSYSLGDQISEFLLHPLREALRASSGGGEIVYMGVLDKVLSLCQVAFWSSVLLSSPLWFREIWLFLRPGLYAEEARVIRPFL